MLKLYLDEDCTKPLDPENLYELLKDGTAFIFAKSAFTRHTPRFVVASTDPSLEIEPSNFSLSPDKVQKIVFTRKDFGSDLDSYVESLVQSAKVAGEVEGRVASPEEIQKTLDRTFQGEGRATMIWRLISLDGHVIAGTQ